MWQGDAGVSQVCHRDGGSVTRVAGGRFVCHIFNVPALGYPRFANVARGRFVCHIFRYDP